MQIIHVDDSDRVWLEGLSYQELLEHFRFGKLTNKLHNGDTGRLFSVIMDSARSKLTPEQVVTIHESVSKHEKHIPGTRH